MVEYLKTPPDAATLIQFLKALDITARQLLRTKEAEFAALGLNNPDLSDAALIEAMVTYPILIERPIAVAGSKVVIGRPPEKVLEII